MNRYVLEPCRRRILDGGHSSDEKAGSPEGGLSVRDRCITVADQAGALRSAFVNLERDGQRDRSRNKHDRI